MEKNYTYEITDNGYYILVDGVRAIHQYEPYIPDKTKSYEENAKAHIEGLKKQDELALKKQNEPSNEERISALEDAVNSILGF